MTPYRCFVLGNFQAAYPLSHSSQHGAERFARQMDHFHGLARLMFYAQFFKCSLQDHVLGDIPGKLPPEGQDARKVLQWNTFEATSIPSIMGYAQQRPEQKRIQELIAELAVTHPYVTFPIGTE